MSYNISPSKYPFHHVQSVQMRFNDLDMFGHVNNTIYLQYMDQGKESYIDQVMGDMFHSEDETLVIVNINCDYCQITHYHEPLEVRTRVDALGVHTITFEQEVVNPSTQSLKCKCRTIMVGYAPATNETIVIPPRWRELISSYEGRQF